MDVEGLTVEGLKSECRRQGLKAKGLRGELVARSRRRACAARDEPALPLSRALKGPIPMLRKKTKFSRSFVDTNPERKKILVAFRKTQRGPSAANGKTVKACANIYSYVTDVHIYIHSRTSVVVLAACCLLLAAAACRLIAAACCWCWLLVAGWLLAAAAAAAVLLLAACC